MPRRDDAALLRDMPTATRAAQAGIRGKNREALLADEVHTLGLVKCVEIIGEAAARLSEEFRQRHAAIPWVLIIGMRHRLVHGYFEIDVDQVWSTLTEDLPPFIESIQSILDREYGG